MFFSAVDIVIPAIGLVALIVWILFYMKGMKYADIFDPLEEKEFPLKEIYFVGYAVMETIGYKYKSKADRQLRQEVEVLYDEKYADYYIRVNYAQKVTISMTVLVFAFMLYGLTQEIAGVLVGLLFAGLSYYYFGTVNHNKIVARGEEMLSDFSEVVSKLALLTNAGMILREAWEVTAYEGDSSIYEEMRTTISDMNNGMAEIDAYHAFGKRCMLPEIKKFASTIVQGMLLGNSELTIALQNQSKEVWNERRNSVKLQGEKASTKLMIPMMVMFVGILIMILVPIFTNLGGI